MPVDFTATFTKEKETKNTIRYKEDDEPNQSPRIGTLYVQKFAAQGAQKLKVKVEEVQV